MKKQIPTIRMQYISISEPPQSRTQCTEAHLQTRVFSADHSGATQKKKVYSPLKVCWDNCKGARGTKKQASFGPNGSRSSSRVVLKHYVKDTSRHTRHKPQPPRELTFPGRVALCFPSRAQFSTVQQSCSDGPLQKSACPGHFVCDTSPTTS